MKTKIFDLLHEHRNSIVSILNELRIMDLRLKPSNIKHNLEIIIKKAEKRLLKVEKQIKEINKGKLR